MTRREDPSPLNFDFFISYVKEDRPWAEWIAWQLEGAGFSVALDITFLQDPDHVSLHLTDLIDRSSTVLVLISKHYTDNQYASEEWFYPFLATRSDSPRIIPILLDGTPPPPLLRPIIGVSLAGLAAEDAKSELLTALTPSLRMEPKPIEKPSFPGQSLIASQPDAALEKLGARPRGPRTKLKNQIFISYSHQDEIWLQRLLKFLKPLERAGRITVWSDKTITPGMNWKQEVSGALDRASAAILLISQDFLASDFINDEELPRLLRAAEQEDTVIIPLILRPSRFMRTPILCNFQSANPPTSPLSSLKPYQREEVLLRVSELIEDSILREESSTEVKLYKFRLNHSPVSQT